jgi:hypothetical protein
MAGRTSRCWSNLVTWSRDLIAADAVGVLVDADSIGLCGDDAAPVHLRTVDGQPSDLNGDQLGRVTMVYVGVGTLPSLRIGGHLVVCDKHADGAPVLPGVTHTVMDLITRGPFHVVSVSLPQEPPSGASYE